MSCPLASEVKYKVGYESREIKQSACNMDLLASLIVHVFKSLSIRMV